MNIFKNIYQPDPTSTKIKVPTLVLHRIIIKVITLPINIQPTTNQDPMFGKNLISSPEVLIKITQLQTHIITNQIQSIVLLI